MHDLKSRNTLGLSVMAYDCTEIDSRDTLLAAWKRLAEGVRPLVLGGGSNVVLTGAITRPVWLIGLKGIEATALPVGWQVEVAAGESWHDVVVHCLQQGWYGLENLALIPGTAGAAPVQNIGAYGLELADRCLAVEVFDLQEGCFRWLPASQCGFGYRSSHFKHAWRERYIIVTVRLALGSQWPLVCDYAPLAQRQPLIDTPAALFAAVCQIRQEKLPDPHQLPNVGSFFENPCIPRGQCRQLLQRWPTLVHYPVDEQQVKLAAGWLIDQAGWRGYRSNGVGVHDQQALVLLQLGGGAQALLQLAREIRDSVESRFGVCLQMEPRLYVDGELAAL